MERLQDDAYFVVTFDRAQGFVRVTRTATAYASVDAYHAEVTTLVQVLAPLDRAHLGLLVDLRLGPLRNDPEYEAAAMRFRREVARGFARVAVLVATHVGRLQIARHSVADGLGPRTFLREDEAIAHAAGRA